MHFGNISGENDADRWFLAGGMQPASARLKQKHTSARVGARAIEPVARIVKFGSDEIFRTSQAGLHELVAFVWKHICAVATARVLTFKSSTIERDGLPVLGHR